MVSGPGIGVAPCSARHPNERTQLSLEEPFFHSLEGVREQAHKVTRSANCFVILIK
jgi:hypothetical protein